MNKLKPLNSVDRPGGQDLSRSSSRQKRVHANWQRQGSTTCSPSPAKRLPGSTIQQVKDSDVSRLGRMSTFDAHSKTADGLTHYLSKNLSQIDHRTTSALDG